MVRGFINVVRLLNGKLARFVVHVDAVGKLLLNDIDFFRVLQALRPGAGFQADDAADDLGDTLEQQNRPGLCRS